MPPNSEIEKLERRWKENPKGTVFAPYAEVLRKHGDHPMAKEVLRQGLELHPDHIPGNIVLGRCCLDLGEEGPAEAAFTHVLDLDPENVIALKALADITERQGRLMEAAGWLNRLMTVDPSNDEAREQHARVALAREAASATLASAAPTVTAPPERPDTATTEVVAVVQPPTPAALEKPASEVTAGEIGEDLDAVVDSILGGFDEAVSPAKTREIPELSRSAVPPAFDNEPAPLAGLEPGELNLSTSPEAKPLADIVPDTPFEPPPGKPAAGGDVFSTWLEEAGGIELSPSVSSEFQSPDDSAELLELSTGRAEFQEPDAIADLSLSGRGGTEYQTPSGAEELLEKVKGAVEPEPVSPQPEVREPPPIAPVMTSGFAAISLMPTEEMSTSNAEEAAPDDLMELGAEPPEAAVSVVDTLAAAAASPAAPARPGAEPESPEPVPAEEGEGTQAGSTSSSDLRLIFPDEADQPEPPRIRRVSEEAAGLVSEPAEPPTGEPVPVVTESMAELYARQGHLAEAINVYRVLVSRTPNDSRLAQRMRELETAQAAGSRRMSYVAVDTGGESVESFFRALAGARPTTEVTTGNDSGPAAPTRPAGDPLSLSSIFGEESASAAPPPVGGAPAAGGFSFDQFFGGNPPSPSATGPRKAMPSDEDLDQFQNWLKSLKR
jgi:tetratricopeptide (TPR) repeat protein